MREIFSHLEGPDLAKCLGVCRKWRRDALLAGVWRRLYEWVAPLPDGAKVGPPGVEQTVELPSEVWKDLFQRRVMASRRQADARTRRPANHLIEGADHAILREVAQISVIIDITLDGELVLSHNASLCSSNRPDRPDAYYVLLGSPVDRDTPLFSFTRDNVVAVGVSAISRDLYESRVHISSEDGETVLQSAEPGPRHLSVRTQTSNWELQQSRYPTRVSLYMRPPPDMDTPTPVSAVLFELTISEDFPIFIHLRRGRPDPLDRHDPDHVPESVRILADRLSLLGPDAEDLLMTWLNDSDDSDDEEGDHGS
jgi:hypothetical protein